MAETKLSCPLDRKACRRRDPMKRLWRRLRVWRRIAMGNGRLARSSLAGLGLMPIGIART